MARRVKGTTLHVPIVHGSHAVWLGNKSSETRSHQWWIYLRPLDKVDLSHFIKHVEFTLHESFEPAKRKVTETPYQITEFGWGEFEAIIRIHFHDLNEKIVELIHPIRLFEGTDTVTKEPVVSEFYDEIVFQDPSERLLSTLKTTPHGIDDGFKGSHLAPHFKDFSTAESKDLKKIEEARLRTRKETIKKQERYEELERERAALVREINSRGGR